MTQEHAQDACVSRVWQKTQIFVWIAFALFLLCLAGGRAAAQQGPTSIYSAGNAAVTGFSGALPPIQIAPGVDPNAKTFIDRNGPSLRIIDLQHMGALPQAQVVNALKAFTFTASQLGQVFGVAIDDSQPPNIYAAATSAYGLPIVVPGPDGQLQHVVAGAANASFMPGLWGPQGGPGSVWKINGVNGQVSLFANVGVRANSGPALGGLAYDPDSKSLFVADRETGFIHRLALNGVDLGTYDHGVTGRNAIGLPPVPWNPSPGIDVTSPQFYSTQPSTWHYAAPERLIFGLAVHQHRLYYAVAAGLQIWSVGLNPDGAFGNDAQIEVVVPSGSGPSEISKITFDEQGRMFLAERPATTGAFDFEALSFPAIGRVLRFTVIGTTASGQRIWQQTPDEYAIGFPENFRNGNGGVAIGYNYDRNGEIVFGSCGGFMWSTGEDLRHPSDPTLAARLGKSGPLDVSGLQGNGTWLIRRDDEPPRYSYFIDYNDEYDDPATRGHMGDIAIERLCSPAPAILRQPAGAPPIGTPPFGAHPLPLPGGAPPAPPPAPPGTQLPPPPNTPPTTPPTGTGPKCPPYVVCGPTGTPCGPNQVWQRGSNSCGSSCQPPDVLVNGQCCSVASLTGIGACSNSSCQPGTTPIGPSNFCCPSGQVYNGASGPACCSGPLVNGQCPTPTPAPPICVVGTPNCCASGYVSTGSSCCLASQMTSTGVCCPAGQTPSGPNKSQCLVLIPINLPPGPQCCASGIPTASGKCCPPANVTTSGECCPGPVDPKNRKACVKLIPLAACAAGYTKMPDGTCCNSRYVSADGKSCNVSGRPCGPGELRDPNGNCVPVTTTTCPPGQFRDASGTCEPIPTTPCRPGEARNARGVCEPVPTTPTPVRPAPVVPAPVVPAPVSPCPPGEVRNERGVCEPVRSTACPPGEVRNERGRCRPPPKSPQPCPRGEERNSEGACVPIRKPSCGPREVLNDKGNCVRAPRSCPEGETRNAQGECVRSGPPPRSFIPPPPPVPPSGVPRRPGPIAPPQGPIFRGPVIGPAGGGLFHR